MVGYYEWEGCFCSRANNTSSLTCFAPHKRMQRTGTLHAYIPARVFTETADTGTSAWEKIFKVSFTCCERCSGCDHMMMDGEIRGVVGWWGGESRSLLLTPPLPSLPPLPVCCPPCVFVALSACSCRSQGVEKGVRSRGEKRRERRRRRREYRSPQFTPH